MVGDERAPRGRVPRAVPCLLLSVTLACSGEVASDGTVPSSAAGGLADLGGTGVCPSPWGAAAPAVCPSPWEAPLPAA